MRTKSKVIERTYVGIDNGVSGSIGIIAPDSIKFYLTPTFSELSYTKEKQNISRIDFRRMLEILSELKNPFVLLERPMVNPGRFKATISALRALESTLLAIEYHNIPRMYIDSKEWQKDMLPRGIKGTDALKKASLDGVHPPGGPRARL